MGGIVQENGQQNNLPPVESNLCFSVQPPTEQTVDIPRGDSNGKYGINTEKNDISPIVQCTKLHKLDNLVLSTELIM